VGCNDDDSPDGCGHSVVDTTSKESFEDSGGPARFTYYTLTLNAIAVVFVCAFVTFLPKSKEQCHEWKEQGERLGTSEMRGRITLAIVAVVMTVRRGWHS
jgi:hypothetical protein